VARGFPSRAGRPQAYRARRARGSTPSPMDPSVKSRGEAPVQHEKGRPADRPGRDESLGAGSIVAPEAAAPEAIDLRSGRIVHLEPASDRRWDEFIALHAGSVYHSSAWLEVVRRTYGYRLLALASERADGTLAGVLPLFA